jgi:uncharacterized protein
MSRARLAAAAAVAVGLVAGAVALAAVRDGGAGDPGEAAVPAPLPEPGAIEPAYVPVAAPAAPDAAEAPERGVTVTGSAVVEAAPDRSEWSFGVQASGETAREALDRASEAARRLVAALRAEGVREQDLRTEQVSVWPHHDGRGVSGYVASTSVRTLVRDLDRAGRVVDAAVGAGANQVSGPGLASGDRDTLYRQALAAAFVQARASAEALARRAGAELGPALAIRESGSASPPVYADAAVTAEARESVPIQPGRLQVSATVTVTFALGS